MKIDEILRNGTKKQKSPYSRGFPYSRSIAETRTSHVPPDLRHSSGRNRLRRMAFRKVESARPHICTASASVIHSSCIFMPPSPAGTARQVFVFRGRGEIVFYSF
jgi:hypothetical protein